MSVLNLNDMPEEERRRRLAELAKLLDDREAPIIKIVRFLDEENKRRGILPKKIEWDEAPIEWVRNSHRMQLDPYTRSQIFKPGTSKQ